MNSIANDHDKLNIISYIILAAILVPGYLYSQYLTGFIVLAIFVFFILAKKPLSSLSFFIVLIPFSASKLLSNYLLELPGFKTFNLSAVLVLLAIFLSNII